MVLSLDSSTCEVLKRFQSITTERTRCTDVKAVVVMSAVNMHEHGPRRIEPRDWPLGESHMGLDLGTMQDVDAGGARTHVETLHEL